MTTTSISTTPSHPNKTAKELESIEPPITEPFARMVVPVPVYNPSPNQIEQENTNSTAPYNTSATSSTHLRDENTLLKSQLAAERSLVAESVKSIVKIREETEEEIRKVKKDAREEICKADKDIDVMLRYMKKGFEKKLQRVGEAHVADFRKLDREWSLKQEASDRALERAYKNLGIAQTKSNQYKTSHDNAM